MNLFQKTMSFVMVACLITSCGGRAANPVMIQQYGDQKKSCRALEMEMTNIQGEISNLVPQTEKTGKNVALGVTGFFLIVPLFFMDLSQSEQIEVNALRQRYNSLAVIATDKNCDFDAQQIPEFTKKKPVEEKPAYPSKRM